MAEVSHELIARFRARECGGKHRERVVVTLRDGADPADVAAAGLWIEHVMDAQPIVTGTLDQRALEALSVSESVLRIEPDGLARLDG
jgi:hypothetical protein